MRPLPDYALGRSEHRRDQALFVAANEPALTTRSAHPSSGTARCRVRSTAAACRDDCCRTVRGHAHRRHRRSAAVGQRRIVAGTAPGNSRFADLKDFDTVARRDIELIHEQLADAGETGWEGFTAIFTAPEEIDVPGMPVKPRRFTAKLSYRGRAFATVPIEVSSVEAGNADQFDTLTSDALGLVGVPAAVAVPCMTIPWQIAQKLHAVTAVLEEPKVNDRAHDLVDLQLLEGLLLDADLMPTRSACIAIFEARAQHPWPPRVATLPHWPLIYAGALEGLDHLELARTVDAAAQAVQRFVARIDRATKR